MNQCIWEYNNGNNCDCDGYCIAEMLLSNINIDEKQQTFLYCFGRGVINLNE